LVQWACQECGGASFVTNDWALGRANWSTTDVSTVQYLRNVYWCQYCTVCRYCLLCQYCTVWFTY